MHRGAKSTYPDKQKRLAEPIEESYQERGVSNDEAGCRAWATVNKTSGGGKKSSSGQGQGENGEAAHKGRRKGGDSAKKGAATRKKNAD